MAKIDLKAVNSRLRKKLGKFVPLSKEIHELRISAARLEVKAGHLKREVRKELGAKPAK